MDLSEGVEISRLLWCSKIHSILNSRPPFDLVLRQTYLVCPTVSSI
jgi:hypothetical protein